MKKEKDTLTILDYLRRNIPGPKQEAQEDELPELEEDEEDEEELMKMAPKKEPLFR